MMRLYRYTVILHKTTAMRGKITFTDKRAYDTTVTLPLESACVCGYVVGQDREEAKRTAICEVLRTYPAEQGYTQHNTITVEEQNEA